MSKMKDLVLWVLEKYDAGYTMSEISRDSLGILTAEQVGQVIETYYEDYAQ